MRVLIVAVLVMASGMQSAEAKYVVGVKDGLLWGRKCYYSDGTIKKTSKFSDCTESPYSYDRLYYGEQASEPSYRKSSSPFVNTRPLGKRVMCFYEDESYVIEETAETCPDVH